MLIDMDTLRIFISSTSEDLQAYREATRGAIHGLDLHADDMIYWSADDRSGLAHSVDRVLQCDVMILLVAHRYGFIPPREQDSIVEIEYRAARLAEIPVLAFFLDERTPWPLDQVEWDARDKLLSFKKLVQTEVTRRIFRTPEELATLVTQALALLLSRRADVNLGRTALEGHVREASTPAQLRLQPNGLVQIGTSQDGLPLFLDVVRSHDLSVPFKLLEEAMHAPDYSAPVAIMESFRQSLEKSAFDAWAAERIVDVEMKNGVVRKLYKSQFTLSEPFTSVLAALLSTTRASTAARSVASVSAPVRVGPTEEFLLPEPPRLQSSGGSNRFLGISPDDGSAYCIGLGEADGYVEWRPFISEDVLELFPKSTFLTIGRRALHCPLEQAGALLSKRLHNVKRNSGGEYSLQSWVSVERSEIMHVIALTAKELQLLHDQDKIHGDVKPHNVLITGRRVVLIDSFDLKINRPAPGWTPNWSPPEQLLGLPLASAADIYPLGNMITRLLRGNLVGEVRKYRTSWTGGDIREFAAFFNPSLSLADDFMSLPARRAWRRFVERSLLFAPEERTQSAEQFADELLNLLDDYPPPGKLSFRPSGNLMAVRMIGGGDCVARAIPDAVATPRHSPSSYGGPG